MYHIEQVDLPGELVDFDEEQELLDELFKEKMVPLEVIRGVISTGFLTFEQLLERYEPALIGYIDEESVALLKFLQDAAYLQEVWSWLSDTDSYKQWMHIYIENRDRLSEIVNYYRNHLDYGYDLARSALDAKNELYLAQTQPGEPQNFDLDGYKGVYEEPDTEFIQVSVPGDGNYDYLLDDPEEDYLYEERGIPSVPIQQEEDLEMKPTEYLSLRHSGVGKLVQKVRRTAVSYRRENYIQRRDWEKLGLHYKPDYLDELKLQEMTKTRLKSSLKLITKKLNKLLIYGIPKKDVLLLLMDGVYIDSLSYDINIPGEGTLQQFGKDFADHVLDNAQAMQDPPGWHDAHEHGYAEAIEKTDFFAEISYDDSRVETSALFNKLVIEHILQGASVKDPYKNAYHGHKMHSPYWALMPIANAVIMDQPTTKPCVSFTKQPMLVATWNALEIE